MIGILVSTARNGYDRWTNGGFQRFGNCGGKKQTEISHLKNIIWNKKVIGGINRTLKKKRLGNMI